MPSEADPRSPALNATVQASAGSGKTYLLVTRLLRLLLGGVRPDAILAITFTRKAAAEMQERLARRLFDWAALADAELDASLRHVGVAHPDAALRQRARGLFEDLMRAERPVQTTTFHAFCQELLRRFPLEADVPPGFELVERTGGLEQEAWDALFEEATRRPDDPIAAALEALFARCGSVAGTRAALLAFLQHRSDWWAYVHGEEHPLRAATDRLRSLLDVDPEADPLTAWWADAQRRHALGRFAELLRGHPSARTNAEHAALIETALTSTDPARARLAQVRTAFLTQKGDPRSRKASQTLTKALGGAGVEEFLELHERLCAELHALEDALARQATFAACAAWYRAGTRLLEHYQRLKRERRLLDFADLEWMSYRLLSEGDNAAWVQFKLDQRIEHLLVDEFQDTNPTQWRLLLPLLEELAAGASERARSVFLVGDAKQSIYGFRRAEPRLFGHAAQWLTEHLAARSCPLDTSWRSSPAIIDFVNRLFGEGELHARLSDFLPHKTHREELWGRVLLLPPVTAEEAPAAAEAALRDPLAEPRAERSDDRHYREGVAIAAEIHRLLQDPPTVGAGREAHRLGAGDVMLLLRTRTHAGEYERALREAAIPYLGSERGTLLESLETRDMVALLGTLVTPFDNIALATVLRSPLFDASDEDLMCLAGTPGATWMQRLADAAAAQPEGSALRRAQAHLARWQALAGRLPAHDLLDRIYSEGNLLARYRAASPPHLRERVEGNLNRFLELALEIDSGRYPSLSQFLLSLRGLRERPQDAPDEATPAVGERVRVLTIHAAKGLEAPIVFLADAAAVPVDARAHEAAVEWPVHSARPATFLLVGRRDQQDATTRAVLERRAAEQAREEANLLYVAVTRAAQALYVSGCRDKRGEEQGWYGAIARRHELDPAQVEAPHVLAEHLPPPELEPVAQARARAHPAPAAVDAALGRPLVTRPLFREIAPSLAVTPRLARGGAMAEDARQRGIAIHRFLDLLSRRDGRTHGPQAAPDAADPSRLRRQVAAELGRGPEDPQVHRWGEEAERVHGDPRLGFLFDGRGYESAYNEVPLYYEHDGALVHGVLDRLLLGADGAWLIDYKTRADVRAEALADYAVHYEQQMRLYAVGVAKLWPERPLKALLLFTACAGLHSVALEIGAANPHL